MEPRTQYVKTSDGVSIAYQVVGDGPLDLVLVPEWVSHLEHQWEEPSLARSLRRLASFSRLILFDKRGTGLSDRVSVNELPTLEQRMDDVRAVMDAARSERAALFGISADGAMCALFAATYPHRTSALVLYGGVPAWSSMRGLTEQQMRPSMDALERSWGQAIEIPRWAPSHANDEQLKQWYARNERLGASPGAAVALLRMAADIDIRHVLPAIRVPTLVLRRADDKQISGEPARYISDQITGAKYVELPGVDHAWFIGDADAIVDEIQEFLTGVRPAPAPDRFLATILFTDIVGSTERAAKLGDRRWRNLLDSYYALARREIERFRGREIKTMGDGFLATFDGPARGVRCACSISEVAQRLGIAVRSGLHTGECEMMEDDLGGIAVHIGARVVTEATAGEVLVSSTVKDLVAGSGLEFENRGFHRLKGVPDEWRLFAVTGGR